MRAFGWNGTFFNESEMALFSECMLQCARNVLTPPTLSETPVFATHAASLLDEREQWRYHPQLQPKPTPALSKESHGVRRLCRSSTTL